MSRVGYKHHEAAFSSYTTLKFSHVSLEAIFKSKHMHFSMYYLIIKVLYFYILLHSIISLQINSLFIFQIYTFMFFKYFIMHSVILWRMCNQSV